MLVDAYLDNLRNRIKLEKKAEGLRELQDWVKAGRRENFTDAERAVSLYEFDGGSITVGDFWNYAADVSMGFSGDIDEAVQWFADDVLLSRALFLKAAREESQIAIRKSRSGKVAAETPCCCWRSGRRP